MPINGGCKGIMSDSVPEFPVFIHLPFDGSLTDYSDNKVSVNPVSTVSIDPLVSKFGTSGAAYFNGGYLEIDGNNSATDSRFCIYGDFTVQGWMRMTSTNTNQGLFEIGISPASVILRSAWALIVGSNTAQDFPFSDITVKDPPEWVYFLINRTGNTCRAYLNGQLAGTCTQSGTINPTGKVMRIGNDMSSTQSLINAWIQDFKFTNGICYNGTVVPSGFLYRYPHQFVLYSTLSSPVVSGTTFQNVVPTGFTGGTNCYLIPNGATAFNAGGYVKNPYGSQYLGLNLTPVTPSGFIQQVLSGVPIDTPLTFTIALSRRLLYPQLYTLIVVLNGTTILTVGAESILYEPAWCFFTVSTTVSISNPIIRVQGDIIPNPPAQQNPGYATIFIGAVRLSLSS